ncbi:hypothetical protein HNQ94_000913 [Salirhabdus euzebyi]|uniref:Uncharacterized protein n=1 Tax=Salirhabdus euzebyi TaxID=394506 RepID=A0A841Q339_9BACI|nr:hypothetical protein [Salirhabdus euzebyi]MBB6452468.1 hypothetical protein [Salirhabdus euzebyi]
MRIKSIMKPLMVVLGVCLAVYFFIYFQNSTIEKVAEDRHGDVEILEQIEIDNSTFVMFDTGKYIMGEVYEKRLFGWKAIQHSQAINGRNQDSPFRTDFFAYVDMGDIGIYYGYVNPSEIESIRFQLDSFDMIHETSTYYWYIPVVTEDKNGSFQSNQFSVILNSGKIVYYPFEEFQ